MPKNRPRKTDRGTKDLFLYEQAYEEVVCRGRSVRAAARMFDLCHVSLSRYKKKRESAPDGHKVTMGYNPASKIFTEDQELSICEYLIRTSDIYYGLSPKEVRRLAFDLAKHYQISRPESWDTNETASEDWFTGFMKRHPELSIRCAQATSLSRATSFNKNNVEPFFNNLALVLDRDKFQPQDIYNMDETGITTVHKPDRIVTRKGMRQVGALTSGERGTLVTITVAVNAIGNAIPAMFVFPRVNYQPHFVRDGPVGCVGAGNRSGWMEEAEFLVFLKHFKLHSNASLEHKVLLTLDNHPSHITIAALDYCKSNGIVMLSFPPHCTHKLQPVDRSVNGPLKKAVNSACNAWMRNNPGRPMTIYDIPSIVTTAYPIALTPKNIQGGFRVTGIVPYNSDIFDEADYSPSFVTDRPDPTATNPVTITSEAGAVTLSRPTPSSNDPLDSDCLAELPIWNVVASEQTCLNTSTSQDPNNTVAISATQVDKACQATQEEVFECMDFEQYYFSGTMTPLRPTSSYSDPIASASHVETLFGTEAPRNTLQNLPSSQTPSKISASSTEVTKLGNAALMTVIKLLNLNAVRTSTFPKPAPSPRHPLSSYPQAETLPSEARTPRQTSQNLPTSQTPVKIYSSSAVTKSGTAAQAVDSTEVETSQSPRPTSSFNVSLAFTSYDFSPEVVRPLPKAPPRKNHNQGRKKGKSAIYTDTPEKDAIRQEYEEKERKKKAKGVKKSFKDTKKAKGKKPKKQKQKKKKTGTDNESGEEEEWFCIVCMEAYANSRSNESWIQCSKCLLWAHEECTPQVGFSYTCHNCESDDSD